MATTWYWCRNLVSQFRYANICVWLCLKMMICVCSRHNDENDHLMPHMLELIWLKARLLKQQLMKDNSLNRQSPEDSLTKISRLNHYWIVFSFHWLNISRSNLYWIVFSSHRLNIWRSNLYWIVLSFHWLNISRSNL